MLPIKFYNLFLVLIIICTAINVSGQESNDIIIDDNFISTIPIENIAVYKIHEKITPDQFIVLKQKNELIPLTTNKFNPGFSTDYFWLRFSVKNISNSVQSLFITLNDPQIDSVFCYEILTSSDIKFIGKGGDRMPYRERTFENRNLIFPVRILPQQRSEYLLMVDRRYASVKLPIEIIKKDVFIDADKSLDYIYFMYFGGIFVIFMLNLSVGILLRDRMIFAYALYVINIGLYLFATFGYMFAYIFPDSIVLSSQTRPVFTSIALISYIYFFNLFIDAKEFAPRMYKFFNLFFVPIAGLMIFRIIFYKYITEYTHYFVMILYLYVLIAFIAQIVTFIAVYKYRKREVVILFSALVSIFTGSLTYIAVEISLLPNFVNNIDPVLIGSIFEFTILTIAIVTRIKRISDEKNELLLEMSTQQKNLIRAYVKGREENSNQVSRELHDSIGSQLALIKNKVSKYRDDNISVIGDEISIVIDKIRKISGNLSSEVFELLGMKKSIENYLKDFAVSTGIKINFYFELQNRMEKENELQIFRVIQEAVENSRKHSNTENINIQIIEHSQEYSISIEDDGVGFIIENVENRGMGLKNMRTRMQLIDAKFELNTNPGKGTCIYIHLSKKNN